MGLDHIKYAWRCDWCERIGTCTLSTCHGHTLPVGWNENKNLDMAFCSPECLEGFRRAEAEASAAAEALVAKAHEAAIAARIASERLPGENA